MGVPGLVVFGLAYMAPLAVFTTYGVVNDITSGHVPAAYLITLAAMLFTAGSYAVLVNAFPLAGSAYTYARRAFGGNVGFITGWSLMLDYLLLPLTNYLLIGIYLHSEFPSVPVWLYSLAGITVVTLLSIVGITVVRNANLLLVGLQLVFAAVFAVLAGSHLLHNPGVSPFQPILDQGVAATTLFTGAATLALSFLGFDAISTMSEEAREPRQTVPRAIILTVVLGGLLFVVVSWLATLIQPDPSAITDPDTAAIEIMDLTAGQWLQTFFLISYLAACVASALASQVSVTRILYAMGRDGVLPRTLFGRLSRKFQTPVGAIAFVSVISLIALRADLATMASIVSFGALAAFSVVNLAVIKVFLLDNKLRTLRSLFRYGLLPMIGFLLTFYLWFSLSSLAFVVGLIWLGTGTLYLAGITRGFRRSPPEVRFDAEQIPMNQSNHEKAKTS
ncbi:APC family permease [Rhodococcus globerulus]|uniref:APC family permease n=1 Tax=Rhodococcus globerulus TaxID=33008 RepID=A0ABU4C2S6_RHOGO|nr:APC family permease [Rhodococcus globerulus]MDV6270802.1 APC family permease [Rhodococcus globerulus]